MQRRQLQSTELYNLDTKALFDAVQAFMQFFEKAPNTNSLIW